jgi:hypothetical protein
MFSRKNIKPIKNPVLYSSYGAYTPLGYTVKNIIKNPVAQEPENEKKKYRFYQKHKK